MSTTYKTKETAIHHLKLGKPITNRAFRMFNEDRDCVLEAIKAGVSYDYYPQKFLNDRELSEAYLVNLQRSLGIYGLFSIGLNLLHDEDFVLNVFRSLNGNIFDAQFTFDYGAFYSYLSPELRDKKEIVLEVVWHDPTTILMTGKKWMSDPLVLRFFVEGMTNFWCTDDYPAKVMCFQFGLINSTSEELDWALMSEKIDAMERLNALETLLPEKADKPALTKI